MAARPGAAGSPAVSVATPVVVAVMLASGCAATIFMKSMDVAVVGLDAAGNDVHFKHPILQSGLMFVGEFVCLLAVVLPMLAGSTRGGAIGQLRAVWVKVSRAATALVAQLPGMNGAHHLDQSLGYLDEGWESDHETHEPLLGGLGEQGEESDPLLSTYRALSPPPEGSPAGRALDAMPGGSGSEAERGVFLLGRRVPARWAFGIPAACDVLASSMLNLGLFYTYTSVYQMLRGTLVVFTGMFTVLLLKRKVRGGAGLGEDARRPDPQRQCGVGG